MSYIHYHNGDKYGIKSVSHNLHFVCKNGQPQEPCETYEEAQHLIDNIVLSN